MTHFILGYYIKNITENNYSQLLLVIILKLP